MKNTTKSVAALTLALLSACTMELDCVLYNNSSDQIVASNRESSIAIEPHTSVTVHGWKGSYFKVMRRGQEHTYMPEDPGVAYIRSEGFGPWAHRVFVAQIDESGRIYAVPPGANMAGAINVTQPEGYPLAPTAITK